MRRLRGLLPPLIVVACALLLAVPLSAQSGTTAAVSGTVTTPGGVPLAGALVTLTSLDRGGTREATADGAGAFRFALLAPGAYELRAEALGYRPVVARTLTLTAGTRASVELPLSAAPPPVLTVDTVTISAATAGRFAPGGLNLGVRELEGLPHRNQDLASVAALDTHLDESLGAQGLPGSVSLSVVDGVPVYRAPHPVARAESVTGPAFPRSALSGVGVQRIPDVEWGGAAGSRIGLSTLTGTADQSLVLEGAWSGAPLWSSSELDFSKPSLLSFEGAGQATVPVTPGSSQIVLSGEVFRQDTPLTPRVSETVAGSLAGIDPDLLAALSEPSVETYSRYSGLLRFDAQNPGSYLFVRGALGYAMRDFDGPGPLSLARDATLPEESLQYSFAAGYTKELNSDASFELRGGVSGDSRTFDAAQDGLPTASLAGSASALGVLPAGAGESSRTDLLLSPVLGYALGGGTLRVGANARLTNHSLMSARPGDYFFSDGPALVAGQGYVASASTDDASFSTRELGGFARFDSELSPGLRTSFGARFDYEWIPEDATLNTAWLAASGLANSQYPTGFAQLGGHANLVWDANPATRIYTALSVQQGDLDSRLVGQLLAEDTDATQTTFVGTGLSWPSSSVPAGATTRSTVTLLGGDTRAPRSIGATAGVGRDLFDGWSVHFSGSFRRSDFLMRRRNLNLPVMAQAADPEGREIFGTLAQDGALVTATGDDALRFTGFNTVWALDPDGWSEYVGATGGLEYANDLVDFLAAYTYSETTDNWIGAGGGSVEDALSPRLPDEDWSEGTSDFDVPHRVTVAATARVSLATISAAYRFRSGLPFTPGYREGIDANGDGSVRNDVAYVDAVVVDPLLSDWACLADQVGGFAVRNSCRGPSVHSLDVRLRLRLGTLGGREASLVVDGLNLVESGNGIVDDALLLVDPTGSITTSPDGSVVTIPFVVNPGFGDILYSTSRGRMLRVGFRIG